MQPAERKANGAVPKLTGEEWRRRLEETDKLDPTVSIRLKGNDYILEFNNLTVKAVLKDTGHNLIQNGIERAQFNDPAFLGALLYQGLHTNHPELTQDEVDGLITYRHFMYITTKIMTALNLFMPDLSDVLEQGPDEGSAVAKDPT